MRLPLGPARARGIAAASRRLPAWHTQGEAPAILAPRPLPRPEPMSELAGSPYPKAELLQRVLARLLDLIVCGTLAALLKQPGAIAGAIYLLLADGMFKGQSLGKRLLGIKVVRLATRREASYKESALRNVPMALVGVLSLALPGWRSLAGASALVLGYEAYRVITDPLGIRLGDALAGTQVVDGKVIAGQPALAAAGASSGSRGSASAAHRRPGEWLTGRQAAPS